MPENKAAHFPVKWLITIVDRGRGEMAAELLNQVHKSVHMISLGKGTASSEIMDYLGLDEPEKDIVMSLIPQPLEKKLLQVLGDRMALSSRKRNRLYHFFRQYQHGCNPSCRPRKLHADIDSKGGHLCHAGKQIIRPDRRCYSSRRVGSCSRRHPRRRRPGGRHDPCCRALGAEEASRFFHITIQPEKEVVFTIVPSSIKKAVMQSICNRILEKSGEHGIVFSLPVDEALGLRMPQTEDVTEGLSGQA